MLIPARLWRFALPLAGLLAAYAAAPAQAAPTRRVVAPAVAPHHSWRAPGARGRGLLYVGLFNGQDVNIYQEAGRNQQLAGQLFDGVANVTGGLAVDERARLYVANGAGGVIVFQPGALMPTGAYRLPGQAPFPLGIAVGADYTLYAPLNIAGPLVVFPKGDRKKPTLTIPMSFGNVAYAAAVDAQNNLFIEYGAPTWPAPGYIEECAPGSTQCTDLGIKLTAPGYDLVVDAQNNLVACDEYDQVIDIFAPGATQPSRTISSGLHGYGYFALDAGANRLFVDNQPHSSGAGVISVFNYATGKVVNTISAGIPSNDFISGVAVSPAAPQERNNP